jgi:hypothetical protein
VPEGFAFRFAWTEGCWGLGTGETPFACSYLPVIFLSVIPLTLHGILVPVFHPLCFVDEETDNQELVQVSEGMLGTWSFSLQALLPNKP